jgi:hypothetical protein
MLLTSSLTIFSAASPLCGDSPWNIKTIDSNQKQLSYFCNIVVDSHDTPHIAYTNSTNDKPNYGFPIIYASANGSVWNTQVIGNFWIYDLLMDTNNSPHALYSGHDGLTYASWTGTQWVSQLIDKNGAAAGSISLDALGNPQVVYVDYHFTVKYASISQSGWTIKAIDYSESRPFAVYIATKNNCSYLIYGQNENNSVTVKMATLSDSKWSITGIVSNIAGFGNMALDSKGYPHFTCIHNDFLRNYTQVSTLFYVYWDGSVWNKQAVASNITVVGAGSLALDSYDNPHVAYIASSGSKYRGSLTYAILVGKTWSVQTVNSIIAGGCKLALDSKGNPHICFPAILSEEDSSRTVYLMYATANESTHAVTPTPTQTFSQSLPIEANLPLLAVLTAVIIAVGLTLVYVFKIKPAKRLAGS